MRRLLPVDEMPIEVRVTVGERTGSTLVVGDPSDAMLATQLGQAVALAVLEFAEEIAGAQGVA